MQNRVAEEGTDGILRFGDDTQANKRLSSKVDLYRTGYRRHKLAEMIQATVDTCLARGRYKEGDLEIEYDRQALTPYICKKDLETKSKVISRDINIGLALVSCFLHNRQGLCQDFPQESVHRR